MNMADHYTVKANGQEMKFQPKTLDSAVSYHAELVRAGYQNIEVWLGEKDISEIVAGL